MSANDYELWILSIKEIFLSFISAKSVYPKAQKCTSALYISHWLM